MKLEVGMYVRTDNGIIGRIYEKIGDMFTYKDSNRDYITYGRLHNEIIKASHNIIDLIEEGDILDYEFGGIISKSEVIKEDNELGIGWDDDGDFINLESLYINSIVTKEQFSSVSYEVSK